MVNLLHKNSIYLLIKILIIIEIIKMIVTKKVILLITIIIIIIIITTKIIICRGRYRTLTRTSTELLVTLYTGRKLLSNVKKSTHSNAARTPYMPLKRLIHDITWWIGVDNAAWIPCLELCPTWFLKNNCNCNINQNQSHKNNYNNNSDSKNINNNDNNDNNNSNNIIIGLK